MKKHNGSFVFWKFLGEGRFWFGLELPQAKPSPAIHLFDLAGFWLSRTDRYMLSVWLFGLKFEFEVPLLKRYFFSGLAGRVFHLGLQIDPRPKYVYWHAKDCDRLHAWGYRKFRNGKELLLWAEGFDSDCEGPQGWSLIRRGEYEGSESGQWDEAAERAGY